MDWPAQKQWLQSVKPQVLSLFCLYSSVVYLVLPAAVDQHLIPDSESSVQLRIYTFWRLLTALPGDKSLMDCGSTIIASMKVQGQLWIVVQTP